MKKKKNDEKKKMMKKKEILLQVPVLEAAEQRYGLNKRLCLEFQFESSSVMFAFSDCCVKRMIGDNKE